MKKVLVPIALAMAGSVNADVAEYKAAAGQFCEKMRVCISEKMEQEMGGNVPPQMRKMIDGMSEQMCAQYVPQMFEEKYAQHEDIIDQGTKCLNDMQDISCSELENSNSPASCQELQKMAEEAGLTE